MAPKATTMNGEELAARLRGAQRYLLAAVFTLVALGLVLIYSASAVRAGRSGIDFIYLQRQCLWLAIGVMGFLVASRFDARWLERLWPLVLLGCLGLLVAVRIPGVGAEINGAYRWLRFAGFSLQPSEVAKLAMVLVLAAILARWERPVLPFFAGVLPVLLLIGLTCGLILIEPDVGTALLLGAVLLAILLAGGAHWAQVAGLGLLGAGGLGTLAFFHRARVVAAIDYIIQRVQAWYLGSRSGPGWHIWMGKTALGSGGVTGVGLGEGPAKLYFLPEAHTDFIFAIAGQELGLAGTLLIVGLYCFLLYQGLVLMRLLPTRFGRLFTFGFLFTIALQAAFNMAVVTALVPPKGISLPFVSFGGSGLCVMLAGVGVLNNLTCRAARRAAKAETEPAADLIDADETFRQRYGKAA